MSTHVLGVLLPVALACCGSSNSHPQPQPQPRLDFEELDRDKARARDECQTRVKDSLSVLSVSLHGQRTTASAEAIAPIELSIHTTPDSATPAVGVFELASSPESPSVLASSLMSLLLPNKRSPSYELRLKHAPTWRATLDLQIEHGSGWEVHGASITSPTAPVAELQIQRTGNNSFEIPFEVAMPASGAKVVIKGSVLGETTIAECH